MRFNLFKTRRFRTSISRHLRPSAAFRERTRTVFLSAFQERFPNTSATSVGRWMYFLRGFASGAAVVMVVSGAAVYADQTNVGPENVLYPLKRSQEVVNLTLASDEEKPVLRLKFAERRIDELAAIEEKDPSSRRVAALAEEIRSEVRQSLRAIEDEDEDENDDRNVKEGNEEAMAPGAVLSVTESASTSDVAPHTTSTLRTERASGRSKNENDNKQIKVCRSFQVLVEHLGSKLRQIVGSDGDFVLRFEKKCGSVTDQHRTIEKEEKE